MKLEKKTSTTELANKMQAEKEQFVMETFKFAKSADNQIDKIKKMISSSTNIKITRKEEKELKKQREEKLFENLTAMSDEEISEFLENKIDELYKLFTDLHNFDFNNQELNKTI